MGDSGTGSLSQSQPASCCQIYWYTCWRLPDSIAKWGASCLLPFGRGPLCFLPGFIHSYLGRLCCLTWKGPDHPLLFIVILGVENVQAVAAEGGWVAKGRFLRYA